MTQSMSSGSPRSRPDAAQAARSVVAARYPDAIQAWLGGSTVTGRLTETSDLDITVLQDQVDAYRVSQTHQGWPVELFVHTEASIRQFVEKDRKARRPTMARLVASSIPLLPGAGGADVRNYCIEVLDRGPEPLADHEMRLARYAITDLLDDLVSADSPPAATAIAIEVWRRSADLLLSSERRWLGGGKWLIRQIEDLDTDHGTQFVSRFQTALTNAISGDPTDLVALADAVLTRVGGRLWDGYHAAAPPAATA